MASWPVLECKLKGVKLQQAKRRVSRPKCRLPVTPSILRHLRSFWENDPHNSDFIMLWAACCTCFFGFLRSGVITVSSLKDYEVVRVHIKASKMDPFPKGVFVYLGKTGVDLCPVAAVSAYLAVRGRQKGPFFCFVSGFPLSRDALIRHVRVALRPSGVDVSLYLGHSFRIGAATTAAAVGDGGFAHQNFG